MSHRFSLVTGVVALSCLAAPAFAEPAALSADKTAKVSDGAAQFGEKIGDVVFERAEIRRVPSEAVITKAAKNPNDDWNPNLTAVFSNPGDGKAILTFTLKLEDEAGTALFQAAGTFTLEAHAKSVSKLLEPSQPLHTSAWPKVQQAHLIASVAPMVITQSFPLEQGVAHANVKVGEILVEQVEVSGFPTAEEITAATDASAKTHPKVKLVLSNPSDSKVKVGMRVVLEDEAGTQFMFCGDHSEKLAAHARSVGFNQCGGGVSMKTAEWPKVTRAHVTVEIK